MELRRPSFGVANELEREEAMVQLDEQYTALLEEAASLPDPKKQLQDSFEASTVQRNGKDYFYIPGEKPMLLDGQEEANPEALDAKAVSSLRQIAIKNFERRLQDDEELGKLSSEEQSAIIAKDYQTLLKAFAPQQPAAPGQAPATPPPPPTDPLDVKLQAAETIPSLMKAMIDAMNKKGSSK
jgi:hypothetical protein